MFSTKFFNVVIIAALVLTISPNINITASENKVGEVTKVYVSMFAEKEYTDLELKVIDGFKNVLGDRFYTPDNEFNCNDEILLDVCKLEGNNQVAISVTVMEVIPEEIVELGRDAEIFYHHFDKKKISHWPTDGKLVRRYMSESYMKQFRIVWDSDLEIININEIDEFAEKICEKYFNN